ncbi:MAG: hypothetical protein KDD69_14145 [Bdellovibrionales bacterium]|nr:hypothetical protein [Bdellovibrionales bacterium]
MSDNRFGYELPLLTKDHTVLWGEDGKCFVCGSGLVGEPHSFATMSGGGLQRCQGDTQMSSKEIAGFLSFDWHGGHSDMGGTGVDLDLSANFELASDTANGQFELIFCTTKCMRQFLNNCVDELEDRIQKEQCKGECER